MLKLLILLYTTCYFCYIFYTREPDYFDGETTIGKVLINNGEKIAMYTVNNKVYNITAQYPLKNYTVNEKVEIIYNVSKPEKAAIYTLWGYWFTWGEVVMSIILLIGLYQLALAITNNNAIKK